MTGDHAVLLDLKQDKYIGVSDAHAHALGRLVHGWPARDAATVGPGSSADCKNNEFMSEMVQRGLLTVNAARGKAAVPTTLAVPTTTLTREELESGSQCDIGHVLNFGVACARAALAMRWRPIGKVVQRVKLRKERSSPKTFDYERARHLVSIFERLRPYFYKASGACLLDSLALVEFLSRYDLFPTWVFAVQTKPFGAHSWVQQGEAVLNDTPEHARAFTPILAI